jgi:hypothetical protein
MEREIIKRKIKDSGQLLYQVIFIHRHKKEIIYFTKTDLVDKDGSIRWLRPDGLFYNCNLHWLDEIDQEMEMEEVDHIWPVKIRRPWGDVYRFIALALAVLVITGIVFHFVKDAPFIGWAIFFILPAIVIFVILRIIVYLITKGHPIFD